MISQISLNSWKQIKERREETGEEGKGRESRREGKRKIFQSLQMGCVYMCFVMPSTPRKAIYNSVLAFSSCSRRAWRSARGESLRAFLRLFCTYTQIWACVCLSRLTGVCGSFSKPLFPQTSHSPAFPPKFFKLFLVCLNCFPLPQASV